MEKVSIANFSGLKPKRGFTSKFWDLDRELRELDCDLTHQIISLVAGNSENKKAEIRAKIDEKMKEIRLISVE